MDNLQQYADTGIILTANRRLATQLREKYDHHMAAEGHQSWPSLMAMPLGTFIEQCYLQLFDDGYTDKQQLNDNQVLLLWEKIIQAQDIPLLRPFATAEKAYKAWKLIKLWQLDMDKEIFFEQQDSEQFYHWAMEFQDQCEHQNGCDSTSLGEIVLAGAIDNKIKQKKYLFLMGFDEIPPLHQQILEQLKKNAYHITNETLKEPCDTIHSTSFMDSEEEIITMAQWAYENHKKNPHKRIACVVPNLQPMRNQIERQFQIAFHSETIQSKVNISGGQGLLEFPLMTSAMFILSLVDNHEFDLAKISYLLRSPYFGNRQMELSSRHIFDKQLRQEGKIQLTFSELIYYLENSPLSLEKLKKTVSELKEYRKNMPKKLSPSQWCQQFSLILKKANWPGDRHIASLEYQLIQRWQNLLHDFSQLEHVETPITYHRGLILLKRLCQASLFQIKTDNTPVQVLGILEAAGNHFDALWVMDLHGGQWPAMAKPNPFIPRTIQTKYKIPHANAERELRFSQQMMERFATMANEIIYSYPKSKGDEVLLMSPLLAQYPKSKHPKINDSIQTESIITEWIEDFYGTPLPDGSYLPGGTKGFQLQAACPFRAFAETRLQSDEIDDPHLGLDAWQRGTTLHEILQSLWEILQNQQTLLSYTQEALQTLVEKLTLETLEKINHNNIFHKQPRFMALEKQRLTEIILDWLSIEKQRTPFAVKFEEYEVNSKINGLTYSLKMDRIDELESGQTVIIDYKTGRVTPHRWFDQRIDDPQIPLYTISYDGHIAGALFAQIRKGESQFKGICEVENAIPKAKPFEKFQPITTATSWLEQQQLWKNDLHALSEEIAQGYAAIDPKYGTISCQYCNLKGLCRVNERQPEDNT